MKRKRVRGVVSTIQHSSQDEKEGHGSPRVLISWTLYPENHRSTRIAAFAILARMEAERESA